MPLAMPGIPPSAPVTRPIAVEHPSDFTARAGADQRKQMLTLILMWSRRLGNCGCGLTAKCLYCKCGRSHVAR